jgi:ribonuclease Y
MKIELLFVFFIVAVILAAIAFYGGYLLRKTIAEKKLKSAEEQAKQIVDLAKKEIETKKRELEIESKDVAFKLRQDFEKETKDKRGQMHDFEQHLRRREDSIEKKADVLERKDRDLQGKEKTLGMRESKIFEKEKEYDALIGQEKMLLQKISGLSPDDAKKLYLEKVANEVRQDAGKLIKEIENSAREEAEKKAKEIVSLAIQRCAAEHTVESTVTVVNLPGDDMKGRIIGREGRNIRAFEIATGVDVIIDDTPEAVTLSSFDPIRREIARIALERLIQDGRIHPGRIEELVEKVKAEMEKSVREEGERAAFEVGVQNVHPEALKLIGRLKYRTSYGQNVLQHSKEVAYLMGVMASELDLDVNLARRIGFLHDVGKSVSHEVEGTHAKIGADLLKKYNESAQVIHALEAHHQEIEATSIYAVLVQAADAISAARPGARRETLEIYIKRLEKLEKIAESFKGVEKTYAIQAGREIRVIVKPDKISDLEAVSLSRDLKKKIEEGLEFPGQIKIVVVRETRAVEYAK